MDVNVETSTLLQFPCYNSLGLFSFFEWLISCIWPVPPYQAILCFALGFSVDNYSGMPYIDSVKGRIMYLNSFWLPIFFGEELSGYILSFELSFFFLAMLVWIRRTLMRWTLSYTRWIYYSNGLPDNTFWGRLWRFCFWFFSGTTPGTFDMENILPSLPLPSVDSTIQRLIGSLAPYFENDLEKYGELENDLKKWCKDQGRGCQRRLKVKKWLSGNYTTLWWESYTFLRHRQSTFMDTTFVAFQESERSPTRKPLARAAVLIYLYCNIRTLLKAAKINPEMFEDKVPLCMAQWNRLFSTTRIPCEEQDELWTYPTSQSKHIIAVHNNHFYKLPIFTKWRRIVSPDLLQRMLQFVVDDSTKKSMSEKEKSYSPIVLTAQSRDEWHRWREDYFMYGVNNLSLQDVETAICLVYIATDFSKECQPFKSRVWRDKSVNFCVHPNAQISIHVDWSAMDPSFFASVLERLRVAESESLYDPETGDAVRMEEADHECDDPSPLTWHCFEEMVPIYARATKLCQANVRSFKCFRLNFTTFGRSTVKVAWHLGIDAFIQAALHATYSRVTGRLGLCAEFVSCRLFVNGRSETLRSLTTEMKDFVRAFTETETGKSAGASKDSKCLELLRTACERHSFLLKHALTGRGVDRHFLSLAIANSFRTPMLCDAVENVLAIPFDLVTCRLPNSHSEAAWQIVLPTMDQTDAFHVTYACRSDPDALDFTISGVRNQIEEFGKTLEQTLLDLRQLLI